MGQDFLDRPYYIKTLIGKKLLKQQNDRLYFFACIFFVDQESFTCHKKYTTKNGQDFLDIRYYGTVQYPCRSVNTSVRYPERSNIIYIFFSDQNEEIQKRK